MTDDIEPEIAPLSPLAAGSALLHSNVFVGQWTKLAWRVSCPPKSAQISGWGHVSQETADHQHMGQRAGRSGRDPISHPLATLAEPLTIDAYVKSKSTPGILMLPRFGAHGRSFRAACLTRSILKAAASVRTRVKDADGDFSSPQ